VTRPLSPIHRPLDLYIADIVEPAHPSAAPPTRISRLAALDQRLLAGTPRSLGPGGASAAFANAIQKALVDEMADQLRGQAAGDSEIGAWAVDIIDAFSGD
jgi:hypothetical protein